VFGQRAERKLYGWWDNVWMMFGGLVVLAVGAFLVRVALRLA
jgi:hypothetical protein